MSEAELYLNLIYYVMAIFAVYRVAAFIVHDTLAEPIREFWLRRFPTEDFYYEMPYLGANVEIVRSWPFRREVTYDSATKKFFPVRTYLAGELVLCFYCTSVWVAATATGILAVLGVVPTLPFGIFLWLGISGASEVIHSIAQRG